MCSTRSHAILKCRDNETYKATLHYLIDNWLDDNLKGYEQPRNGYDIKIIREYNDRENKPTTPQTDQDIRNCLDQLIELHVPAHLVNTTSHREWIQFALNVSSGLCYSQTFNDRIARHDLSKYSHKEVLGYGIMFQEGAQTFRALSDPEEKAEWDRALLHHYEHNDHHPEHFYRIHSDGKRDKSQSILSLNPSIAKEVLIESLLDMLASRGERNMKNDTEFSVQKWFDIEEKYLLRYATEDKLFVQDQLQIISNAVSKYVTGFKTLKTPAGQTVVD